MKNPKLTLVGAGPGDPELITLKGIKALEAADVVLYDALANDDLLAYAKNAKVVEYVGKRQGDHSLPQETINEAIVRYALEYGHVVRLKGGDPFVFGRGFEELEFAAQYGIPTTVVPGISSATSLAGLLHIPITHRGISRSFHVFSATTKDGELSEEIRSSVHLAGTRVVLMGLKQLGKIAALYQQHGLGEMPVAVIQNGSLENQKTAFGIMKTIENEVEKNGIQTPSIIVIGEVVSLKFSLIPAEVTA
ncbi:MAG: uroporphyrinogen-III C-methyltransferase [Saprospiraceae bacterium]